MGFRTLEKPTLMRIAAERGLTLTELMQGIVHEYVAHWPGDQRGDDTDLWAAAQAKARARGTTLEAEIRAFLRDYLDDPSGD